MSSLPETGRRETPYGERFTLFAEVAWVGVLVTVGSLPLVTWPAAMAAGCAAVRRCVPDGPPASGTARRFAADFRAALPGGLRVGAAGLAALAFIAADLRLAAVAGDLPGFGLLAAVCAIFAGAVVVAQLRAAALWSGDVTGGATGAMAEERQPGDAPGARGSLLRAALRRARHDPAGSAMLGGAVLASAVCVWQLTVLAPLVAGVLALAAVAVERRVETRDTEAAPPSAPSASTTERTRF
ncbi:hypothetical protein ACH429_04525 [Streptomyces pathocidini]|uniref:DUF624 domain-containing protein n=1 Tax=Streptomyces pathocidini TaxID=1650571 RepID=A0ABW7UL47_9ACTN|nr:hypothetical protein [Streptomyces pathocidini]